MTRDSRETSKMKFQASEAYDNGSITFIRANKIKGFFEEWLPRKPLGSTWEAKFSIGVRSDRAVGHARLSESAPPLSSSRAPAACARRPPGGAIRQRQRRCGRVVQPLSKLTTVPLVVRNLTDRQMVEFMGRENLEDFNSDFLVQLEAWESAIKFLGSSGNLHEVKPIDTSRLLGWTRARSDKDNVMMNDTAKACNSAFQLIQGGHLDRDNLADMSVGLADNLFGAQAEKEAAEAYRQNVGRPEKSALKTAAISAKDRSGESHERAAMLRGTAQNPVLKTAQGSKPQFEVIKVGPRWC
jgi:hypothetical protein